MRTRGFLAVLVLPVVLVTACGTNDPTRTASDPAPTTSTSSSAPSSPSAPASSKAPGPQCADVWVAGEELPNGYGGCYQDSKRIKPGGRYCEFGKPLMTYDDRFYAVRGGRIAEADKPFADDVGYQDVLAKCSG